MAIGMAIGLTVGGPMATAGAGADAQRYVVLEARDDAPVRILHSQVVYPRAPRRSLAEGEMATRRRRIARSDELATIRLRDAAGGVVFQDAVAVPRWLRGEFHGVGPAGEPIIDGHVVPLTSRVFVARLPAGGAASLAVEVGTGPTVQLSLAASGARARTAPAVAPPPLPGWDNGNPANRVDLLIMGDGYTAAEAPQFEADARNLADLFVAITPYDEYRNYLNISALFVPSPESGADHPPYDPSCTEFARAQSCCGDPDASLEGGRVVSTAFGATYCSFNLQRLLTVDTAKVLAAAAAVPDWDQILVLVNDATYGGSGGDAVVVSTHPSAAQIAQHEHGHRFTQLADEYELPSPGYPPCSDVTTLADCEANVTDQTDRALVKWNRWIAASLAVPSVGPPPLPTDAGAWEGARYVSTDMYRQGYDCLMRVLGAPFGDVASEAYVLRLYAGGWGTPAAGIDNIEPGSESPSPGSIRTSPASVTIFGAGVLGPIGGPPPTAEWRVDGVPMQTVAVATGATATFDFARMPGTYTLELRVTDESPIIHPTLRAGLAGTRSWVVTVTGNGVDTDGDLVPDRFDNCPTVPNVTQADREGDGVGDACTCGRTNDGAPCDDGDACTAADACAAGRCVGGLPTSCDDGDPCTEDVCAVDGCRSTAMTGLDAVTCVFAAAALQPPLCGGERIPARVSGLLQQARRLIDRAPGASQTGKAKAFVKRGVGKLKQAATVVTRARISPDCARALAGRIDDARHRARDWLRASRGRVSALSTPAPASP